MNNGNSGPGIRRRLAAVLAADVVGYSKLMSEDEVGTLERWRSIYNGIIRLRVEQRQGRIFNTTGDGVLAEFESVVEAVQCAVGIQRELRLRNENVVGAHQLVLRIGINLGDVIIEGDDIYGDGVNIAARLEACATPGAICISRAARDQIRDKLPYALEDLGDIEIKNAARPVRAFQIKIAPESEEDPVPRVRLYVTNWKKILSVSFVSLTLAVTLGVVIGLRQDSKDRDLVGLPGQVSVAVLPLDNANRDPSGSYFYEGIAENIIGELSRRNRISVVAGNSAVKAEAPERSALDVGNDLNVDYVVDGEILRDVRRVQVTVAMVEIKSGTTVWSERYDRELVPRDMIELEGEIAAAITTQIADHRGVVPTKLFGSTRSTNVEELTSYDCTLRHFHYDRNPSPLGARELKDCLEQTIEREPSYALARALLADVLVDDVFFAFGQFEHGIQRGHALASKAVELEPNNQRANVSLTWALFNMGDREAFRAQAKRTVALNPNHAGNVGALGSQLAFSGDWEQGMALLDRAVLRDPDHPAWYSWAFFYDHYRLKDYRRALLESAKFRNDQIYMVHVMRAAVLGQLGLQDQARAHLDNLLQLVPDFPVRARTYVGKYLFEESLIEQTLAGLRKAGLEMQDAT